MDEPPRIRGRVWIGHGGSRQEQWDSTLLLDRAARSELDIAWPAMLPDEKATGWLSVDLEANALTVDPAQAR